MGKTSTTRISRDLRSELFNLRVLAETEMKFPVSMNKASSWVGEHLGSLEVKKQIVARKVKQYREGLRGSISDIPVAFAILLTLAIVVVIIYIIIHGMQTSGAVPAGLGSDILLKADTNYPSTWDNAFVFGLVALMLGTCITAYIYRVMSLWFWLSAIMLGFYILVVGLPMGLIFQGFAQSSIVSPYLVGFPKIIFFFANITKFMALWGGIILLLNHMNTSQPAGFNGGGIPV